MRKKEREPKGKKKDRKNEKKAKRKMFITIQCNMNHVH